MIQPLRRWHFRIWIVLAILLPVLFVAGLLASHSTTTPVNPGLHWEPMK